jgi:hypothetical protein|tara:strand:+ start:115 stop:285 length:171 start_codon:yes stop_codon:yes gene_type:complete
LKLSGVYLGQKIINALTQGFRHYFSRTFEITETAAHRPKLHARYDDNYQLELFQNG